MTHDTEHVDFETLNDYVDGSLDSSIKAAVDKHLAICSDCSAELESLQDLLANTALLSRSALPEDDLWLDLKASIESRKQVVLPSVTVRATETGQSRPQGRRWGNRIWMAAAGIALVVSSSAITAIVLRRAPTQLVDRGPMAPPGGPLGTGAAPVLPMSFRVAEGQYVSAIEELRTAVDAQRTQLNPETVRTVDRSLAVVDSAIAEARDALLADPNNRTLVDLLSLSYQRKLDLLRRTSELTSRI